MAPPHLELPMGDLVGLDVRAVAMPCLDRCA